MNVRPTPFDSNLVELNYYSFMISLDKCNGSCNAVGNLSAKICVPSKTKDVNVKVSNMIRSIFEAKKLVRHISCDCKCKILRHVIQIKNGLIINVNMYNGNIGTFWHRNLCMKIWYSSKSLRILLILLV